MENIDDTFRMVRQRMAFGQTAEDMSDLGIPGIVRLCSLLEILDLPIPVTDGASLPAVAGEIDAR